MKNPGFDERRRRGQEDRESGKDAAKFARRMRSSLTSREAYILAKVFDPMLGILPSGGLASDYASELESLERMGYMAMTTPDDLSPRWAATEPGRKALVRFAMNHMSEPMRLAAQTYIRWTSLEVARQPMPRDWHSYWEIQDAVALDRAYPRMGMLAGFEGLEEWGLVEGVHGGEYYATAALWAILDSMVEKRTKKRPNPGYDERRRQAERSGDVHRAARYAEHAGELSEAEEDLLERMWWVVYEVIDDMEYQNAELYHPEEIPVHVEVFAESQRDLDAIELLVAKKLLAVEIYYGRDLYFTSKGLSLAAQLASVRRERRRAKRRKRNPGYDERMRAREREAQAQDPRFASKCAAAERIMAALPRTSKGKIKKRMTVREAEKVIKAALRHAQWAPDPHASVSRDVWITPSRQSRVTFLRSHVVFEVGGRGRWQRDYGIHQWGHELRTKEYAERLIATAKKNLSRRGDLPDQVYGPRRSNPEPEVEVDITDPEYVAAEKAFKKFHGVAHDDHMVLEYDDGKREVTTKYVAYLGRVPETHYTVPEEDVEGSNKNGPYWVHHHDKNPDQQPIEVLDPQTGIPSKLMLGKARVEDWWRD